MRTSGNTILITGGATGIGFSLAEAFVNAGNEVIICGRRRRKLKEARDRLPQIHTEPCDVSKGREREALYHRVILEYSSINILVNNAGIQRMIDLTKGTSDLLAGEDEIEVNMRAFIHLSAHFIPHFLEKKEAAIINVSSGLGFIPMAQFPVYCATKAAIHSFSLSLRHQLRDTPIKVFEIIPPTVDTELNKAGRGARHIGMPPAEVASETLKALERNEFELAVGMAQGLRMGARTAPEETFQNINR